MLYRVAVIGSLIVGLASTTFAQLDPARLRNWDNGSLQRSGNNESALALVSGVVRSQDNHGIPNARIELRDINGVTIAGTYSGPNGSFQLNGVPAGRYELVATVGLSEAREHMALEHGDNTVSLRVAERSVPDAGNANSVSLADMRVPEKARKALSKAREMIAKHRDADAQKEIAKALEVYPQYSDALRERAVMKFVSGQPDEAAEDLQSAIKYDPNNGMAYVTLAAIFNNQNKYDDAARTLERGISLVPNAWQAYFENARTLLGKGDFAAALRNTDRAAQLLVRDDYPILHLVRAHALLGLKNYNEAQNELETYITRDPQGGASAPVQQALDEVKTFTARASSGK